MGDFADKVNRSARFTELELQSMFAGPEEKAALAHVQEVLRRQTDDLTAINSLISKGGAVLGVVAKLVRSSIGVA